MPRLEKKKRKEKILYQESQMKPKKIISKTITLINLISTNQIMNLKMKTIKNRRINRINLKRDFQLIVIRS